MVETPSRSRWMWTLRFLLLGGASVLVFLACVYLGGVYGDASTIGAIAGAIAFLCVAGFAVGIIGAVVSFVMAMRGRPSPPAKPVA
jgi:hypothetical protein